MRRNCAFALIVFIGVLPINQLSANVIHESQRIVPKARSTALGSGGFDGNTLLLFSREEKINDYDEAIRVFKRGEHDTFFEVASIPGTFNSRDFFGSQSSIQREFALLGSPSEAGYYQTGVGSAGLYQHTDAGWVRRGGAFGTSSYDYLGSALDLDTKALIIGAPGMSNFNFNYGLSKGQGAVFVATTETDWNDDWTSTRLAPTGSRFWDFGAAVAIHGNTAVVGAPGDDGREPARTWVFQRDESGFWKQVTILQGDSDYGRFGIAVDVRDGMIVVGDPNESGNAYGTGAAYIFRRDDNNNWIREAKLTLPGSDNWTHLGSAIRIGEDGSLLVSAPGYSGEVSESGAAFLYSQDESKSWNLEKTLLPSVPQIRANFGSHLEYQDGIAVVSSEDEHGYLGPTGAAYIFRVAVPEPTGCALLATAFLLLANVRLRHRSI